MNTRVDRRARINDFVDSQMYMNRNRMQNDDDNIIYLQRVFLMSSSG